MTKREAILSIILAAVVSVEVGFGVGALVGWKARTPQVMVFALSDTVSIPIPWESLMCAVHDEMRELQE